LLSGFAAVFGAVLAAGAAAFGAALGAGCAVCARAESVIPTAITPVIKAKISTRHMLEWFPQYCDWKMARPRFVPRQG
jgi:predicted transcriptional regulator